MKKYELIIEDIIDEGNGVNTFVLSAPNDFTWEEGSCMHVGLPGFDSNPQLPNKSLVHHMSIASLFYENKILFTTRFLENPSLFKEKLKTMNIGDTIKIFKISSHMKLRREDKNLILISMGLGMATIRPLLKAYLDDKSNIKSIKNLNINSSEKFVYKKEFDQIIDNDIQHYWYNNRKDFYNKLNDLTNDTDNIYYIVGTDKFLYDVINFLREKNVTDNSIVIDKKEEKRIEFLIYRDQ